MLHALHRMRMRIGWAIILTHAIAFLVGLALALGLFCAAKRHHSWKYREYKDGMTLRGGECTIVEVE